MFSLHSSYTAIAKAYIGPDAMRYAQTSRQTKRLYRYNHETSSSSLLRRDLPPIIIIFLFLFLIIIILSQILVVHTSRHASKYAEMHRIQDELKQMDKSMETMLQNNVLPIEKWRLLFHIQTYVDHFQYLYQLLKGGNQSIIDQRTTNSSDKNFQGKNLCSEQPSQLQGPLFGTNSTFVNATLEEMEGNYSNVRSGGQWSPSDCLARHRVAIIIPYRDRLEHLTMLLYYLHPILQRQELDYKIYLSEQVDNGTYNKGVLMNAAFIYASNEYDYQCFVFHDVDLIPENDRNMYSCPDFPRHMSVAIDEMNYNLIYEELIGGVFNIRKEHFLTVNGYSDLYWGWGAEDDDLYYRLKDASLKIIRPPAAIGRYRMIRHTKRTPSTWNKRAKLLYSAAKRYSWDGISTARYNLTSVVAHSLFTHLLIDVGEPPPGFN